jgi:hypothetical protein
MVESTRKLQTTRWMSIPNKRVSVSDVAGRAETGGADDFAHEYGEELAAEKKNDGTIHTMALLRLLLSFTSRACVKALVGYPSGNQKFHGQ